MPTLRGVGSVFITLSLVLLAILPQQLTWAHFVLNYPKSRGFDESLEPQAPCGGYNTVSATRIQFPIDGGSVQLTSAHPQATFKVNFAKAPSQTDFLVVEDNQSVTSGTWNASVSFTKLKAQSVDVGTEGTLQITYEGGDGTLYQCSDIVLVQAVNATATATSAAGFSSPAAVVSYFAPLLLVISLLQG